MVRSNSSDTNNMLPFEFHVSQNYPNPFRGKTTIKYCIPYKTRVKLIVYDSSFKTIDRLVDEEKKAGTYEVDFVSGAGNRHLPGGVYLYRLEAGEFSGEKKMEILT
jgi:hypothetical protein